VEETKSTLTRRASSVALPGTKRFGSSALAAAAVLVLAGLGAGAAYGDDAAAPDVPASAIKGKKVAYVACSDLNRYHRRLEARAPR
jgi:hypothetical protein